MAASRRAARPTNCSTSGYATARWTADRVRTVTHSLLAEAGRTRHVLRSDRGLPDADEGKDLRVRTLSALPPWLMIAIGFVFFAAISAGCRFALSRVASQNQSAELDGYAGKLRSVFRSTVAVLVG